MQSVIGSIDKFFSQTEIIKIGNKKYAKKKYTKELGIIKWFIIKSLSIPVSIYPFVFNPRERMRREIDFFDNMYRKILVPKVIEVNWDKLYIIREYVEGHILNLRHDVKTWSEVGTTLHKVHNEDYSLGDSKVTNFLVSKNNTVYIIDAEQAIASSATNHRIWDIIVFLATVIHVYITDIMTAFMVHEEEFKAKIKAFLESYADSGGSEILEKLRRDTKSKMLIHVLIPFPYNLKFLRIIKDAAHR
ncbi:hypothetical protein J4526_05345 [Desulfurococcaceae archaeon MEX13E-LK6-19]|nr:hypothetical protein J4526_05345 [Desulfurococcaceae archaeon MEX13E-LK6-19]